VFWNLAVIVTAAALVGGAGIGALAAGGFALLISSLYFWLLDRFENSILFWIIMTLALLIGLV
jgi:hypothetical protein